MSGQDLVEMSWSGQESVENWSGQEWVELNRSGEDSVEMNWSGWGRKQVLEHPVVKNQELTRKVTRVAMR